eukprot:133013_1
MKYNNIHCIYVYFTLIHYGMFMLFVDAVQYITIEEELNFKDAEKLCLFRYDTHLSSIHNDEDLKNAINATDLSSNGVWIGLTFNNSETEWQWTDLSPWDYGRNVSKHDGNGPWADGEPNNDGEYCVQLSTDEKWTERSCTEDKFRPLCRYPEPLELINDPQHYIRKPCNGTIIGFIDILDEIYIEFNITFERFPQGLGSLLHFGNERNERFPAIFIDGHSNSLQTTISVISNVSIVSHNMSLELNTTYQYIFHLTQNYLEIELNNDSNVIHNFSKRINSHSILMNRKMFLGNPWNNELFDAQITNLYVTTSNQYQTSSSDSFNYACETNRWDNDPAVGNWIYDGDKCEIKQQTYDHDKYTSISTWLGDSDPTSMNWTDYKVEIEFVMDTVPVRGNAAVGILLRTHVDFATSQKQGYLVAVRRYLPQPILALYVWKNGPITELKHTDISLRKNTNYTLRVEAAHNNFEVYWNNEFAFTETDNQFSHGSVGLHTYYAAVTFSSVIITFNSDGKLLTVAPTTNLTVQPTPTPTDITINPTPSPSTDPTTYSPTSAPTFNPTSKPTNSPTSPPQLQPTVVHTSSTGITQTTNKPLKLHPSPLPTTIIQEGVVSYSTTTNLNTESKELQNINTASFTQKIGFIVLVIVSGCLIFMCICIRISYSQRYKQKQMQNDFANKTLTQLDLGNITIMHYISIQAGTILDKAQHALPTATPGVTMPGLPTCIGEPESSLSDNDILENDADSEDNETNDLLLTNVIITKGREQKMDEQSEEKKVDEVELNNNIKPLYHEKQKWELCLLHALNSLLQREEFTHK